MLRIETRTDTNSTVTYALSGRATQEHLPELVQLLADERTRGRRVTLDLEGLILADREFVRFLACGEGSRAELAHCPAYVLSWIRCEGEEERKPS
ncbi:MAG: STAS domain-containing protein, partial [Thermoanaerobaculia bacterium]